MEPSTSSSRSDARGGGGRGVVPSGLLRRALSGLALVVVVTIVAFVLLSRVPGDPARTVLVARGVPLPTPAEVAAVRRELGLGEALPTRYLRWASAALSGDLGTSYRTGGAVADALAPRLARTAVLALVAGALAILLALATAPAAAARPGGVLDRVFGGVTALLSATPAFVLGLALASAFALGLGVLPAAGDATAAHYVLPALTLGLLHAAAPAGVLRGALRSELGRPYAMAARARGLSEADVVGRHALRNAAGPYVALVALSLRSLLGGAVVVETVFGLRGLGTLLVDAVGARDVPIVLACLLVLSVVATLFTGLAEVVAAALDPRPASEAAES